LIQADYSRNDLAQAIHDVGIRSGDVVSLQVSLGRLGLIKNIPVNMSAFSVAVIDAFLNVLGNDGTLVVPTYTYSIGKGELFDVENTPSAIGEFPEVFRTYAGAIRSRDPMLSHAALGPKAGELMIGISNSCYGEESVFDRLRKINAKICMLGVDLHWATFRHYIERMANVPFRFDKVFEGKILEYNQVKKEKWIYFASPKGVPNCDPNGIPLEKIAKRVGLTKEIFVGRGKILAIESEKYFELGIAEMIKNPWLTAKGPAIDLKKMIKKELSY